MGCGDGIPPSPREIREGAWAILRASAMLNKSGHGHAVLWARGYLGLDDR